MHAMADAQISYDSMFFIISMNEIEDLIVMIWLGQLGRLGDAQQT